MEDRVEIDAEVLSASDHVLTERRKTRAHKQANQTEVRVGRFTLGGIKGAAIGLVSTLAAEGADVLTTTILNGNASRALVLGGVTVAGCATGGAIRLRSRQADAEEVAGFTSNQPAGEVPQPSPAS